MGKAFLCCNLAYSINHVVVVTLKQLTPRQVGLGNDQCCNTDGKLAKSGVTPRHRTANISAVPLSTDMHH